MKLLLKKVKRNFPELFKVSVIYINCYMSMLLILGTIIYKLPFCAFFSTKPEGGKKR